MRSFKSAFSRTISVLLCLVMILSMLCVAASADFKGTRTGSYKPNIVTDPNQFTDITGHWAETSLRIAAVNGIMFGVTPTTMDPDGLLTRAQMAAMLVRAFEPQRRVSILQYVDISPTAWYYDSLERAVAMGVINGDGNYMHPNSYITRQEACVLIHRAFRLQTTSTTVQGYADIGSVSSWAYEAVAACAAIGALRSTDGSIHPQDPITRAEFASMMYSATQAYETSYVDTIGITGVSALISDSVGPYYDLNLSSNLYLADGLNTSDVQLVRSYVNGYIVIRGGGSLQLTDNTIINKVVIEGNAQSFTLTTDASSHVNEVIVNDSASVTLHGNFTTVTANSSKTPVYITGSFVENLQSDPAVTPMVTIDDISIIENFEANRGYIGNTGYIYTQLSPLKFSGNFDVLEEIMISGYNPIQLHDTYGCEIYDFVQDLSFSVDNRTHKVYIAGDLYKVTFGSRNQFTGYYVPMRFMLKDATENFDVVINGTTVSTQAYYDGDTLRLNVLIPFTSEYRTATVEFVPVRSNRWDSVSIELVLESTVRFR